MSHSTRSQPGRSSGRPALAFALILGGLVALTATPARADLSLTLDQSAYTLNVGDTRDVTVSLHSTDPTNDLSGGLYGAGILVSFSELVKVTNVTPPSGLTLADPTGNGFIDPVSITLLPATSSGTGTAALDYSYLIEVSNGAALPTFDASGNIALGTFSMLGAVAGTDTISARVDPSQGASAFVDGNGTSLTLSTDVPTASITVNSQTNPPAVPEPSTIKGAFVALVAVCFAYRRRAAA